MQVAPAHLVEQHRGSLEGVALTQRAVGVPINEQPFKRVSELRTGRDLVALATAVVENGLGVGVQRQKEREVGLSNLTDSSQGAFEALESGARPGQRGPQSLTVALRSALCERCDEALTRDSTAVQGYPRDSGLLGYPRERGPLRTVAPKRTPGAFEQLLVVYPVRH